MGKQFLFQRQTINFKECLMCCDISSAFYLIVFYHAMLYQRDQIAHGTHIKLSTLRSEADNIYPHLRRIHFSTFDEQRTVCHSLDRRVQLFDIKELWQQWFDCSVALCTFITHGLIIFARVKKFYQRYRIDIPKRQ